ncbi:hypothetical protein GCM10025777_53630 [Membranihabitans marinus]
MWETNSPSQSLVEFGAARYNVDAAVLDRRLENKDFTLLHEVTLPNLEVETNYFYRVTSITEFGDTIRTGVLPFKTAVKKDSPYAFTVFSDSQSNPDIWGKVTKQALRDRPDFAVHGGDLVGLGYRKEEWVHDFFAPSHGFMKQIPMFTILGNHEHDAAYYYEYFKNPEPEHFYQFTYGNAEFFMIDTDQYQEPGTVMYHWLEHALARSTAKWKFIVHHHPPYSTEENDFGDTNYEKSTQGDDELKMLVPLYEKYGVDIVFYGHIHMYERTWPLLDNKVDVKNGIHYINVGGSGGRLEEASPTRSWFTNKVRTTFHYAYVAVNDETLQYQAIDENGLLFDQFTLDKSRDKTPFAQLPPVTPRPIRETRIFTDTLQVQLNTVNPADNIYYTTDGSIPSAQNGKRVNGKIILNKTTQLKAIAINDNGQSPMADLSFEKVNYLKAEKKTNAFEAGLRYDYYTGKMQDEKKHISTQLKLDKEGVVRGLDFEELPNKGKDWGVSYQGYMDIPQSGYYRFYGHGYHIFRFYLHDELKMEEYNREVDVTTEVYLEKGLHPFELEYQTHRYYQYIRWDYKGPNGERHPVSDLKFYYKK